MAKINLIFILFSLFIAENLYYANGNINLKPEDDNFDEAPIVPLEQWFQNLNQAKQKLIKIHLYIQDFLSGENATTWQVAESKITSTSQSLFATVCIGDNLLTAGPQPDSAPVGRIQGVFGFADLKEVGIFMSVNIVFTHGKYKGSTISVSGRNPMFAQERELSIVGGTGVFRMARGMAYGNTFIPLDELMSYQVLEVTLYAIVYE